MRRAVWAWARVLAGVAIIALLVGRLGTGALVSGVRLIDTPAVLAALAIGGATTWLSAARWCLVARRLGLRLPLRTAVPDYYRALFLNAVLPAGVLGDVDRAVRHGREQGDVGRGLRAVVLERTAGQVAVVAAGVGVLLVRPTVVPERFRGVVMAAGAVLVAVTAGALVAARFAHRRRGAASRTLNDLRTGLLARDAWPGVALLSAAVLAGYLALFIVAARTAGATAPASALLPPLVLALLAMGLPLNIGGWGPREGAATLTFGAAGLGAEQGLATAVVYGVLVLIAALPGGCLLVLRTLPGRGGAGTAPAAPPSPAVRADSAVPAAQRGGQ